MTFSQKRKLKNDYMPKYSKNLIIGILVSGLCYSALVAILIFIFISDPQNEALLIALVAATIMGPVYFIVLIVLIMKLRKRLLCQRTEEIESEFTDMPFEEAETQLAEKKVITEHGFVADRGEYAGQLVVPFKEAAVSLHTANIYTKIITAVVISDLSGNVQAEYILDKTLYNYILKKGVKVIFNGHSNLIVTQKNEFVKRYLVGDNEKMTMTFLFGMLGALLSDEEKNINASKKIVLNVLSKEINKCQ